MRKVDACVRAVGKKVGKVQIEGCCDDPRIGSDDSRIRSEGVRIGTIDPRTSLDDLRTCFGGTRMGFGGARMSFDELCIGMDDSRIRSGDLSTRTDDIRIGAGYPRTCFPQSRINFVDPGATFEKYRPTELGSSKGQDWVRIAFDTLRRRVALLCQGREPMPPIEKTSAEFEGPFRRIPELL
jgi:hypothetical protein